MSAKGRQACWITYGTDDLHYLSASEVQKEEYAFNNMGKQVSLDIDILERPKIFQFAPDHWELVEYNTAGLRTKMTSFADRFGDYQILAVANSKPIYLVTPRGEDYLNALKIIEITD